MCWISRFDATTMRRSEAVFAAPLPPTVTMELLAYLEQVRYPLAVRSSSLLEDSQYQPFTGVYQTFMLPNQQRTRVRLAQSDGGDQARVRVDVQSACEGVYTRDAISGWKKRRWR